MTFTTSPISRNTFLAARGFVYAGMLASHRVS
jgi:hypothetical protein